MKAVSYWFWIIGSVLIGLLVFSLAVTQLTQTTQSISEEKSIEEFNSFSVAVNTLCWEFIGNIREISIDLSPSVVYIYATQDKHTIPEEGLAGKLSEGSFLCLLMKEKRPLCNQLDCNVTLPYLSSSNSLSSLVNKLLGKPAVTTYKLKLEKVKHGVNVIVE